MLPIQTILCPTDFSAPSYEGLKTANELAHHFSARLVVLYVNPPIPVMTVGHAPIHFDIPAYQKEMEGSARKELRKVMDRWIIEDVESTLRVAEGDPAEEIESVADDIAADLIVIATHGRTGWRRFVLGSVTEKLVRSAQRPVLTIHCREEDV